MDIHPDVAVVAYIRPERQFRTRIEEHNLLSRRSLCLCGLRHVADLGADIDLSELLIYRQDLGISKNRGVRCRFQRSDKCCHIAGCNSNSQSASHISCEAKSLYWCPCISSPGYLRDRRSCGSE